MANTNRTSWIAQEYCKKFKAPNDTRCRFGIEILCYSYKNNHGSFLGKIYLRNDGKVAFESLGKLTGWHGSWQPDAENCSMLIEFSYRTDEDEVNLKKTLVFKNEESSTLWTGRNDSERFIVMSLLVKYRHCMEHNSWHSTEHECWYIEEV